jgi:penicillin-binding protein 1A
MVSLGDGQSGAVAALPIWKNFFSKVIDDKKKLAEEQRVELEPEEFEVPPNLYFMEIDLKTGLLRTPVCLYPFMEVFAQGMEPPFRYCTLQDHMRVLDYYATAGRDIEED